MATSIAPTEHANAGARQVGETGRLPLSVLFVDLSPLETPHARRSLNGGGT